MEFKFRTEEDKDSTYFPPGSSNNYFTEQALRAGYISNDFRRNDFGTNPADVRDTIQRQLEKERIREEIITAEIMRKRALEAEVRRELIMERELALRMGSSSSTMRPDPRLLLMGHPDGSRLEDRLSFPSLSEGGVFERLPFQRHPETKVPEDKPITEVSKEQVKFLAKPMTPCLAGTKRKATTPAVAAGACELPTVSSKKKPQKEWSCALCQVSATCEQGLNDHLQGKKHKAKEAGLRSNKTNNKNTGSSAPLPKKTEKPTIISKTTVNPNPKQEKKPEGKKQQVGNNGEAPVQKKQKTEDLKKKNGDAPLQKKQKKIDVKRKSKFWCEMCQTGANSEVVLAAHQRGKKHLTRLRELKQDVGGVPASIKGVAASKKAKDAKVMAEKANEQAKNAKVVVIKANEETVEKIDGQVDGIIGEMKAERKEFMEAEATEEPKDHSAAMEAINRQAVANSINSPINGLGSSS